VSGLVLVSEIGGKTGTRAVWRADRPARIRYTIVGSVDPIGRDDITLLLERMRDGDEPARERLIALVYPRLKQMAAQRMRGERPDHTLQPTALVHEVFLRLSRDADRTWRSRVHFFAFAAELMRHILVDAARRRRAVKRGGANVVTELNDALVGINERPELILEVDRLLTRLEALDARQAKVVEMRFFVGLTESEIAEALGLSERTVKREWQMARAWMQKELASR
jgi:RNA polymerase sigma factor (TIGR02999 family)